MTASDTWAASAPAPGGTEGLRRYEMRIRTVLSPAVVASFPLRIESTTVPRRSVRRLYVEGDRDLTAVVRRLAEAGVEVLDVRVITRCA